MRRRTLMMLCTLAALLHATPASGFPVGVHDAVGGESSNGAADGCHLAGDFRLSGDDARAAQVNTTAEWWLGCASRHTRTRSANLSVFRSGPSQGLSIAAPEPGTIALLAMAGLLGMVHRKKRRTV